MPLRPFSSVRCLCLVLAATACSDPPSAPATIRSLRGAPNVIPVIPLADTPDPTTHPCRSGPARQFDFWLGDWNVTSFGSQAGTNRVLSEVDGCVVAEYWMGRGGVPGWSLNAYDPETGAWHQHWVAAGGGNLFLSGGMQGESMVIAGARRLLSGATVIDRIAYTPLAAGEVRQFWDVSQDGGQTFPIVSFDGLYSPRPVVVPATEVQLTSCASAPYHTADFLHGEWMIRTPDGDYVGKTEFSSQLSNCLILQTTKGRAGYESKAFLAYGFAAGKWRLTHVGSDAERLFLEGSPASGTLVLQGSEIDGGVTTLVRLTYTSVDADHVTQQWERSTNGGTSWQLLGMFDLTRH